VPENEQNDVNVNLDIITPEELARRLKLRVGTIYNRLGQLGRESGVVRLGPKCTRINWPVFWARLCDGQIDFRPRNHEQRTQR
jgi:hypothetical protein